MVDTRYDLIKELKHMRNNVINKNNHVYFNN